MKITEISNVAFLFFFKIILLNFFHFPFSHCANLGSETDKLSLLAFKSTVADDPLGALSTWNDTHHFCQWQGVTCSLRCRRVIALDLRDQNLTGTISPHIGNLTFLRTINLQRNYFYGNIPQEFGRLFRLQSIILNHNIFQREIPVNLTRCSELRILDLVMNNLEGKIPSELGCLSKLQGLGLAKNNLTGFIPQSLSNLSFLEEISLSHNSLTGNIPVELSQLKWLNMFQVSVNFLNGCIPLQLFNITSMDYFSVTSNQLFGEIPPYIGFALPNIRVLLLAANRFTGKIPHSISNATKLEQIDLASNFLTGSIPQNLGRLKNLIKLNFDNNNLGTGKGDDLSFLNSLVNCTYLEVLSLTNNSLSGILPNSIANFSSRLTYLYMSANQISGTIPTGIGNLKNLIIIAFEENFLTGKIPTSVGNLGKIQVLSLFGNKISGEIPPYLGNLTFLTELNLQRNSFQGSIPSTLGNCQKLHTLDLSGNNLSGTIPSQVIGLTSLSTGLYLSLNQFTGPIPMEIGSLKSIRVLDLSENKLSGDIPSSLANCIALENLNLSGNSFHGPIPPSLSSLKGLQDLDLSLNNFSGKIPDFLETFPFLQRLSLSFNNLEGVVPKQGIFKNASATSIIGNSKLCGGIPEMHLNSCQSRGSRKFWQQHISRLVILTVSLSICLLSTCLIVILYLWRRKRRRKTLIDPPMAMEEVYMRISCEELLKATDGFSSANLIGTGGYGFVYKGNLGPEETAVAMKVLDLQQRGASKSFIAECEALRRIRHRNLVKIITSCSSVDAKGHEFKALVYEFMPNGSLEKWLHHKQDEKNQRPNLKLMERLCIAIDVANALDYLHHHCHTRIVHCDLKPSNVLLDNDMVAHVGDFGLARLLCDTSPDQTSSSRVKGSIGYVAPEYGALGKVSTYGDVYSFGILVLEMFTGKRPTDDMFKEGLSLHSYARMGLPDQVAELIDPMILEEALQMQEGIVLHPTLKFKIQEILVSVLRVGVLCSAELPSDRMQIKDAIVELQGARKMIQAIRLQDKFHYNSNVRG